MAAKKKGVRVGVLGFLQRVVAATMGCFIGCFRVKESRYHPVYTPKEHTASRNKNALASLFRSDESDKDSEVKKGHGGTPLPDEVNYRELKDEAKFLKACGTLLETPIEIRKVSSKCAGLSTQREESSKFNSWILSSPIEKPEFENQPDESSSPVKIRDERVNEADSFGGSPSSCMTTGHNTRRDSVSSVQHSDIQSAITPKDVPDNETEWSAISSVSSEAFATSVKRTNRSVRFECQSDRSTSSSKDPRQCSNKSESSGNSSGSKLSPYPTPLKLTDEMQTPGTVYPAYMNNIAGGKTTKIRSQYVYSVLNPIEYQPQLNGLEGEKTDSSYLGESPKPNDEATSITTPISSTTKGELSLSHWLNPDSANHDGKRSLTSGDKIKYGISPGDRPIIGIVAAHWNNEDTHISPKWDGNGIPNTTTKYKEDQKVKWHATPFEERLEKALSDDTLISQRRPVRGALPVELSEIEESDSSPSQVQSSGHLKSIVTF